jgi:hypothetical protein
MSVFSGLLQTPDYAYAVHEAISPPLAPDVITERIEVRSTGRSLPV